MKLNISAAGVHLIHSLIDEQIKRNRADSISDHETSKRDPAKNTGYLFSLSWELNRKFDEESN